MEVFTVKNLTFSYPQSGKKVLDNLSFSVRQGEFVTICGPSGCGKTTLLRQLKTALIPHGYRSGEVLFQGRPLAEVDRRTQSARIGFVMQSPDNQIVTDKVWHELAFGLESLGLDPAAIRLRVGEMASFFGIQNWFHKNVSELSGGQKQLLNLASIMAMQPAVLILDEPTSQLDPIAASEFLAMVEKINRELGVTVILTEHRLEEAFAMSDRVLVMDRGRLICDGTPEAVGRQLKELGHGMFLALPVPMRVYGAVESDLPCPVTVREGRLWLDAFAEQHPLGPVPADEGAGQDPRGIPVIELDEVWFRYEKEASDVVKGLTMKVYPGEFFAILGGNGTGKTTALSLIAGLNKPYRGTVKINGVDAHRDGQRQSFGGLLGVLPQNPQAVFVNKTVREDLLEMLADQKCSGAEKERRVEGIARLCRIQHLLSMHPYDLSGGEQQRAALAKVLLLEPKILLLDEPTKGLDAEFKRELAGIIRELLQKGVTVLMVSHDIEFCARYAHRCAMFFDGHIISCDRPRRFFASNSFYTTAANRMARHRLPDAVTAEDVILACGGDVAPFEIRFPRDGGDGAGGLGLSDQGHQSGTGRLSDKEGHTGTGPQSGIGPFPDPGSISGQRGQSGGTGPSSRQKPQSDTGPFSGQGPLPRRTWVAMAMLLVAVPLTIYFGIYYLGDRKYFFISTLIVLETMLPFVLVFEGRKPRSRELIVIAVLCALGVMGRTAFFMLPQFKPVIAIIIIAGAAFGGEAGFLVGSVTAFVSDMFFGQGPWTPWQMFALGLIGFLAGLLFRRGMLRRNTVALCLFGGLATFFIYGGIMNPAGVLTYQARPTIEMFYVAFINGFPFDIVHAASTVLFLWICARPMLEKLDRIKVKYGLIE